MYDPKSTHCRAKGDECGILGPHIHEDGSGVQPGRTLRMPETLAASDDVEVLAELFGEHTPAYDYRSGQFTMECEACDFIIGGVDRDEAKCRFGEHFAALVAPRLAAARREAVEAAADAIQALHPGEVKNSVVFLREFANGQGTPQSRCHCGKYALDTEHAIAVFNADDEVVSRHAVGACAGGGA